MDVGISGLDGLMDQSAERLSGRLSRAAGFGAGVDATGAGAATSSFTNALADALKSISQVQNESTALQKDFQLGVENVSLEKTMMAMQNAQIAFQSALTVRNRLVSAYSEIMNMQV